jgi:hypothetical protein
MRKRQMRKREMRAAQAVILGACLQFTVSFGSRYAVNVCIVQRNKPIDMHTETAAPDLALTLVEIIELKWLLAGEGVRVHVERLQNDPAYAERALRQALDSSHPLLRATATRLKARLGLT